MNENHTIHFLARLFNKNSPVLRINSANPQSEYEMHVISSLQPWEDGKKKSMEMNPTTAATMEYDFIKILNGLYKGLLGLCF